MGLRNRDGGDGADCQFGGGPGAVRGYQAHVVAKPGHVARHRELPSMKQRGSDRVVPRRSITVSYAPSTRGGLLIAIVMMAGGLELHFTGVLGRFDQTVVLLVFLVLIGGLPRVVASGSGWWRTRAKEVPAAVVYGLSLLVTITAVSLTESMSSPVPAVAALVVLGVLTFVSCSRAVAVGPVRRTSQG